MNNTKLQHITGFEIFSLVFAMICAYCFGLVVGFIVQYMPVLALLLCICVPIFLGLPLVHVIIETEVN